MFKKLVNFIFSRTFTAGQSTRLNNDWITSTITANEDIKRYLSKLVDRSLHLSKNNSYYRKWLKMRQSNIIGHKGFKFQCKSVNTDGKQDTIANDTIEYHWNRWGKAANKWCTVDGYGGYKDLSDDIDRNFANYGEALIHIHDGFDNPYGFALEMIDPTALDVNKNVKSVNGDNRIIMGVEVDSRYRPVAYWIKNDIEASYQATHTRVPADQIIHLFKREFPGQVRGFPTGAAAILDINSLQGYMESEIVAARVAACQMGIWENVNGKGKINPTSTDAGGKKTYNAEPGQIIDGPPGRSLKMFSPSHPNPNQPGFIKSILRSIANGLGIAYNNFANDLEGVNFSSLRGGTVEERDFWKLEQEFQIENCHEIIYRRWLRMFLISGLSNLRLSKIQKYSNIMFQGRRWSWVDPYKDVLANIKAIGSLLKSPQEVIRERGGDPEEVINEIVEFENICNKHGLTLFEYKKGALKNAS